MIIKQLVKLKVTQEIYSDFTKGNFTKPFFIHAQSVPGTDAMTQNKDQIQYKIQDLKNGSILILGTNNSSLISPINQFMTFQLTEHKGHWIKIKRLSLVYGVRIPKLLGINRKKVWMNNKYCSTDGNI